MFDKLVDLFVTFIEAFQVYTFVNQYEQTVILRCGKFHRVKGPGFRWLIPAKFERSLPFNVVPDPMELDIQSLHTQDGYAINFNIGLIWKVTDIRVFLLEWESTEEMIGLLAYGVCSNSIIDSKWAIVNTNKFLQSLKAPINRKVRKRGAEVTEIMRVNCSNGEAARYWHEGIEIG